MALVKCNECGHEVSDKATACPHCGNPAFLPTTKIPIHINAGSFIDVCLKEIKGRTETVIPLNANNSATVTTTKEYKATCRHRYLATSKNPVMGYGYSRSETTYAIGQCSFCVPYDAKK